MSERSLCSPYYVIFDFINVCSEFTSQNEFLTTQKDSIYLLRKKAFPFIFCRQMIKSLNFSLSVLLSLEYSAETPMNHDGLKL